MVRFVSIFRGFDLADSGLSWGVPTRLIFSTSGVHVARRYLGSGEDSLPPGAVWALPVYEFAPQFLAQLEEGHPLGGNVDALATARIAAKPSLPVP